MFVSTLSNARRARINYFTTRLYLLYCRFDLEGSGRADAEDIQEGIKHLSELEDGELFYSNWTLQSCSFLPGKSAGAVGSLI